MYKLFTWILQKEMWKVLNENQPRQQAGFRKGYSTVYHRQIISQLIEKYSEFKIHLCIGYIDYEKAFDSIEHEAVFKSLRPVGINENYITVLKENYTEATAIHVDNRVSEKIPILGGVRQGDPISPTLFTATIQEVFKNAQLEEKGINIGGEKQLDLRFAGDVALTTEDVKDMEHQLNTENEESLKIGLKIHKGKTKSMTNIDTTDNIQMEGTEIEKVTNYKYLRQTVAMENKTRQKVLIGIKRGWSEVCLFFCLFGFFLKEQRNLFEKALSHESRKKGLQPVSYQQWHMDAKHGLLQKH